MRNMNPLVKMVLRMFFYSAAVFTITHWLLHYLYFHSEQPLRASEALGYFLSLARWSVPPALVLALPLPLFTVLFFRNIRRPASYQFAMLCVTLITAITIWGHNYVELGNILRWGYSPFAAYAAATIAIDALTVYMSVFVAGKYVRDVNAQR